MNWCHSQLLHNNCLGTVSMKLSVSRASLLLNSSISDLPSWKCGHVLFNADQNWLPQIFCYPIVSHVKVGRGSIMALLSEGLLSRLPDLLEFISIFYAIVSSISDCFKTFLYTISVGLTCTHQRSISFVLHVISSSCLTGSLGSSQSSAYMQASITASSICSSLQMCRSLQNISKVVSLRLSSILPELSGGKTVVEMERIKLMYITKLLWKQLFDASVHTFFESQLIGQEIVVVRWARQNALNA